MSQKIDKLDSENTQLRLGKGDNKKMKELENEIDFLKLQLEEAGKSDGPTSKMSANQN